MKALSKLKNETGLWLVDAPIPDVGRGEVRVKIKKTAICGTDLHIYKWDDWAQKTIKTPMIVGHEFVGYIEEIGEGVTGLKVGDRVSGEGHIVCGSCYQCRSGTLHLCPHTVGIGVNRQGAFAEYLVMPASNVVIVPDSISDDIVSMFDPLGNAVHTALSFDLVGEDVLITGAGPIGMMAVKIAKSCGARHVVITDINDYRLKMAEDLGAIAINVKDCKTREDLKKKHQNMIKELDLHGGYTVGLEMSGHETAVISMIDSLVNGGKMSLLGISGGDLTLPWNDIVFKGLFLKGIYGREMYRTWHKMISLIEGGMDVSSIVTHVFSFEDFQKGFDLMLHGQCGKVVLEWS